MQIWQYLVLTLTKQLMNKIKAEDFTSGRVFLANQSGTKIDLVQRYASTKSSAGSTAKFKKHKNAINDNQTERYGLLVPEYPICDFDGNHQLF